MNKLTRATGLLCLVGTFILLSSCSQTVYVRQNGTTYNDYEAIKHSKVVNKTKRPKVRSKN
jgi:hypothetical protein